MDRKIKMETIKRDIFSSGQSHLLQHWEKLNNCEQERLLNDLSLFCFTETNDFFENCIDKSHQSAKISTQIEPLPEDVVGSSERFSSEDLSEYARIGENFVNIKTNTKLICHELGYNAIAKNQVALILLAGGQGTRLGVPYPKGMYDVGLPSHKTLYQLQAEKIIKVQENAKRLINVRSAVITWYIMTSEHTNEATEEFFKQNNYFGLQRENIIIFEQHMLPCYSFDGKVILETPNQIAKAPDGNGGLYKALKTNKVGILVLNMKSILVSTNVDSRGYGNTRN